MELGRLAVLALVAGGCAIARAAAGEPGISAVYAFSWAGLDVGRLEVRLEADAAGYRAGWEADTTGLAGTLFPFTSQGTAEGRRDGDRFLPDRYDGSSAWGDGGSRWHVRFAPDGRATQVELPPEEVARREPVPDALQVAPDPASLLLGAIEQAGPGVRLDGQSFDGRRAMRVELACADAKSGAELPCTVSGRLLAGASRQGRPPSGVEREPWRVWLRGGVHGEGLWPVRLEAPTRFGTVTARLIRIDRVPAAG